MKLETVRFGEIEWEEEQVVEFPQGLPGFESLRGFLLVTPDESVPISYLQSVEDGAVSFMVTNPFWFYKDYEFDLPEAAKELLQVEQADELTIWSIISAKGSIEDATLNLQAPVTINAVKKLGAQVILHDSAYHTRHKLLAAAGAKGE